ncbi:hypothetical protein LTR56_021891 [Elasticomyces elasticus]|nr:hypothetical protein LTR56_021891 [Elasticomyces elasticus]KAK4908978.1 hypothetical protein LTR49_022202 [Elasticomyces elasticus]KAK5754736.1 hypothetical protein LTS12_015147 [Elasticomyces elasticus]
MPGAGKQAPEVQARIRELLEAGFDPTTIHKKLKVGRSSIYRMKRCLEEHGTAYMPSELNKKNGRPKVLTAEQELEVRDWLRHPPNRTRYLDDLVWLIHDRFGTVCSTTTMSKLKRKWMRVIEAEETGHPLGASIREQVLETHPDLPILHAGTGGEGDVVRMTEGELEEYRRLWRTSGTSRVRAPRSQVPARDSPSSTALEGTAYPPPPPEEGEDGVVEERLLSLPQALRRQQEMAEREQQIIERQRQQVPWPELPDHHQHHHQPQQHHGVVSMTAQEQVTDPRLQLPLEPYYGVPAYVSGMQRELAS